MNDKNIEIEIRGPLDDDSHKKLLKYLEENGKFLKKQKRFLVDYSTFLEGVGERKSDVRLRVTNGKIELIVKKGKFGGFAREEASVFLDQNDLKGAFAFMALLGFKKGVAALRQIEKYDIGGIEVAVQDVLRYNASQDIYCRFFEAEIMANRETINLEKDRIMEFINKAGLSTFDEEEWNDFIKKLNREANGVYDYEKDDVETVKKMIGL